MSHFRARTAKSAPGASVLTTIAFNEVPLLIGILSDTHDHADAMQAAVTLLSAHGADFFIHCGDVGGQRVLDCLAGHPAAFVWGNTDYDRATLARYANQLGIACHGAMADLELDGKRIAVLHGDDLRLRQQILDGQQFDYLLQGHTHAAMDQRIGKTRIINPGALHRAREKTAALLDTQSDTLQFMIVSF
ncbi:MAG TPA: YfcE family phosphodiesterase [Tepidisphaeraceae bacterium]|nr:YfcE family phosphodiesterase [Tepidisphaeraceae bacterium]